mmetsp:Transcript_20266/g.34604  ORF Transcript_20266/g.34604 Transcript_20266/m.34604 type:complete len:606 (+) Transcript_20266:50-1867(+)
MQKKFFQFHLYIIGKCKEYETKGAKDSDRKALSQVWRSTKSFTLNTRIYRSSHWQIEKKHHHYSVEKYRKTVIHTSHFMWRWKLYFVAVYSYTKNIMFGLLVALFAGPFSLRALFGCSEFYPDKIVDGNTGELKTNPNVKVRTVTSMLGGLWTGISDARRKFEDAPDNGLVGKGVTRLFNLFWWYICVGLIGTLFLGIVVPIGMLVLIVISFALLVTAVVWVPVCVTVAFVQAPVFIDFMAVEKPRAFMPLVVLLVWDLTLRGIVQIVLSILAAFIFHPLLALFVVLFASIRAFFRYLWDKLMMLLILRPRGRVPASNSFFSRRVGGPGISFECAFQIDTDTALTVLQSELEKLELQELESRIHAIKQQCSTRAQEAYTQLLGALLDNVSVPKRVSEYANGEKGGMEGWKLFQDRCKGRRALFISSSNYRSVRQSSLMLAETLTLAEQVTKAFIENRILPSLQQSCPHLLKKLKECEEIDEKVELVDFDEKSFWQRLNVKPNDYSSISKNLLKSQFGERFVIPLEASDRVIEIEAKNATVGQVLRQATRGQAQQPLSVLQFAHLAVKPEPRVGMVTPLDTNAAQHTFDTCFVVTSRFELLGAGHY